MPRLCSNGWGTTFGMPRPPFAASLASGPKPPLFALQSLNGCGNRVSSESNCTPRTIKTNSKHEAKGIEYMPGTISRSVDILSEPEGLQKKQQKGSSSQIGSPTQIGSPRGVG